MNPTATATERLKPSHHSIHRPPTSENGSDSMTINVSGIARKFRYSRRKMINSVTGTTTFRRHRALQIFELAAPGDVVARRELHVGGNCFARIGYIAAEVPVANVNEDVHDELAVFGTNARRATPERYRRDFA
jgi:hypothetical protein